MRIFHPLRGAPMALLWGGLSLSALGDQLYAVALTWIAVEVLGPRAGYLGSLQALIVLLAVLGIGRWADRWDHRRSMIGADVCRAAILAVVVVVWLIAGGPSPALLIAAVVVLAIGQAVFRPALQSLLPGLVADPHLLPAANGLLDATDRSARLIGPGLVALLAGLVPAVQFFTIDSLSFLISAAALMLIGRHAGDRVQTAPLAAEKTWRGILRGWRAMTENPLLGFAVAITGPLSGIWYGVFFLGLPLLIAENGVQGPGGSGLGAYGFVLSAYGVTNLAATIVFGSRLLPARPQFQMFGGTALVGLGIAAMAFAVFLPPHWRLAGLATAAALGAPGGPMKDIPAAVLRQTRLRPADMPAAMRVYMAWGSAGTLVGMLLAPAAVAAAGAVIAIAACGVVYGVIGVTGMVKLASWIEPALDTAIARR